VVKPLLPMQWLCGVTHAVERALGANTRRCVLCITSSGT